MSDTKENDEDIYVKMLPSSHTKCSTCMGNNTNRHYIIKCDRCEIFICCACHIIIQHCGRCWSCLSKVGTVIRQRPDAEILGYHQCAIDKLWHFITNSQILKYKQRALTPPNTMPKDQPPNRQETNFCKRLIFLLSILNSIFFMCLTICLIFTHC